MTYQIYAAIAYGLYRIGFHVWAKWWERRAWRLKSERDEAILEAEREREILTEWERINGKRISEEANDKHSSNADRLGDAGRLPDDKP